MSPSITGTREYFGGGGKLTLLITYNGPVRKTNCNFEWITSLEKNSERVQTRDSFNIVKYINVIVLNIFYSYV